ncbi:hypothetical protein [Sphingopyxis sp.]|nr:hypothetical protein [Sphingopyxis sp.]
MQPRRPGAITGSSDHVVIAERVKMTVRSPTLAVLALSADWSESRMP